MLRFNLGCIGQYSWPAAGENHRRRRVHRRERRHTACLLGRCWFLLSALSAPYLCGELQPHTPPPLAARTPLLHPHRRIFMWTVCSVPPQRHRFEHSQAGRSEFQGTGFKSTLKRASQLQETLHEHIVGVSSFVPRVSTPGGQSFHFFFHLFGWWQQVTNWKSLWPILASHWQVQIGGFCRVNWTADKILIGDYFNMSLHLTSSRLC